MKIKLNRERELETILVMCVGFLVIYFVTKQQHTALLYVSIALGAVGVFSKYLTAKIAWLWAKIGEGMGFVMSKVILSLVFFIFLLPLSILSRVFSGGKDSLQLSRKGKDTYYTTRNHTFEAKDLENTW